MKTEDLIPWRTYRLTRSVPNPERDRRTSRCFATAEWETETLLRVEPSTGLGNIITYVDGYAHHGVHRGHSGYAALVDAMELLPESAADVLRACGSLGQAVDVLDELLSSGVIDRRHLVLAERAMALRRYGEDA